MPVLAMGIDESGFYMCMNGIKTLAGWQKHQMPAHYNDKRLNVMTVVYKTAVCLCQLSVRDETQFTVEVVSTKKIRLTSPGVCVIKQ